MKKLLLVPAGTRLERVVAHEGVLEKQYTLVTIRRADVDGASFEQQMSEMLVGESCANKQSRKLYEAGVSEWFTYQDTDGEPVATIKVGQESCA